MKITLIVLDIFIHSLLTHMADIKTVSSQNTVTIFNVQTLTVKCGRQTDFWTARDERIDALYGFS